MLTKRQRGRPKGTTGTGKWTLDRLLNFHLDLVTFCYLAPVTVRGAGKALKEFHEYQHDGGFESLRKRLYTARSDARAKLSPGDWALVARLYSLATPYRYDDTCVAAAREPDCAAKLREDVAELANELESIKRELAGRRQIEKLSAVRRMLDAAEENIRGLAELAAEPERKDYSPNGWTDEELTSLLEDMWRRGCSSSEIAFHLAIRCARHVQVSKTNTCPRAELV